MEIRNLFYFLKILFSLTITNHNSSQVPCQTQYKVKETCVTISCFLYKHLEVHNMFKKKIFSEKSFCRFYMLDVVVKHGTNVWINIAGDM